MQADTSLELQALSAVGIPYIIEWLKQRKWFPWLDKNSTRANQIASGLFAIATNAGLAVSLDGNWAAGGRLIIDFPAIGAGTVRTALSYIAHQWVYESKIQKTEQSIEARVTHRGDIVGTVAQAEPVPVPEPGKPEFAK